MTIDGEEIAYNKWTTDENGVDGYGPIQQEFCGENRYIGVDNIFEFYLDGSCEVGIQPRDAIQTRVRMEWGLEEFFADGGTTTFVDRLCGSLGIHASTVKIIGAKEGSLIVDYEILPSADEPLTVDQIRARQTEQFATGAINLGAPITDVSGDGEEIVADGVAVASGFPSVVLEVTATNGGWIIWLDWIMPWAWSIVQTLLIDAPVLSLYEFWAIGLTWLWNDLSKEVIDMAEEHMSQAEIDAINDNEEHDVIVAPQEDFGMDAEFDDTDFAPDAGAVCTGPDCLTDGPDSDL